MKTKHRWPQTVAFHACPKCGQHGHYVFDGRKHSSLDFFSIEKAFEELLVLVLQRVISRDQAMELVSQVVATELLFRESEAVTLCQVLRETGQLSTGEFFQMLSGEHHAVPLPSVLRYQ